MKKSSNIHCNAKYMAAGALLLFGRYAVARLLSGRWGKRLHWPTPSQRISVECPSGNTWIAEFDGPADAPPLVFIHGINANASQWYYQREYFKDRFRLVFLTLPLHIPKRAPYRLAIPTLAADLNHVLTQLNLGQAVVYGHSMGGMVLLQYCTQHFNPAHVKAIVLQGASYTNPVVTNPYSFLLKPLQRPILIPWFTFLKKHRRVFNLLSGINFLNGLSFLFYRYVHFAGAQTANQLLYIMAMAPTNDTGAVAESVLQLMHYNVAGKLPYINTPVLILSGLHDRLNTVNSNLYLQQHLPQAQLAFINAGHQGMVEKHREVNTAIREFIDNL
jgi:pimeloyl-ACP methyl ester carboxylesterase